MPVNPRNASAERGMSLMLAGIIVFLAVSEGLNWQLSLGYGMSVKNALLYVLAVALIGKFAVQQNFSFEVGELYVCFAILIAYAILSMIVAAFAIDYDRYKLIVAGMAVKNRLIDNAVFFLVFFYGMRDRANAQAMIRFLLFAAVFANCLAVLDALGFVQVGDLEQREDGRVNGVMGEANQYGAYVAMLLPGILAAAVMTRGVRRLFWLGGSLISAIALLLTVSRGAYVAVAVSAIWVAVMLRRYLSFGRIVAWGSAAMVVGIVLLAIVSVRYGDLLEHRLMTGVGGDAETLSSGRTAIWAHAIARMYEAPISFITGFGWHAYETFPFRHAPHNYYLWLWFNMGVVGVTCGILLFTIVVRRAREALAYLPPEEHPTLIGFVTGTIALAVASFFVDLYSPWVWYWAYAGLAMRVAVSARRDAPELAKPVLAAHAPPRRDPFGWAGSAR